MEGSFACSCCNELCCAPQLATSSDIWIKIYSFLGIYIIITLLAALAISRDEGWQWF
jgi:hypothetical protein